MKPLRQAHLKTTAPGNRGMSLITVLAIITLLSVAMIAFLLRAKHVAREVEDRDGEWQAETVAEEVIHLATAQIRRATSEKGIAWASQPGAIRTWDQNGALRGGLQAVFG
ncbi:MAG: hypothetical protein KDM64_09140 [Verrucomicrobiae bacterium]|nr:hypothetical protein [Verrucomicrobiae bacterium]